MATIRSQLVLTDGMSGPLRSIHRAMNMALNSFEAMQSATSRPVDVRGFQAARDELARLGTQLDTLEQQTHRVGNAAGAMQSKFLKAAAAIGAALSIKNIIGLADNMTQTTARLNLITGDEALTKDLQSQIMASANRSRAGYQTTADSVAKMGIMAKDAFKGNTAELVQFTELINKQFTIAGTSAAGIDAAMLQLTQAMSSGVLRGEELNSIFEQAPTIIQTIADYLGVPIGQIRSMAAEGLITADIVKNAMFDQADKINEKFDSMPYTWSQVWTLMKNIMLDTFGPLLQAIGKGAQFIYNNWSTIEPILAGLAVTVGILTTAWALYTAQVWLAEAANRALIVSMLSNPVLWLAVAIGILVALLYRWIQAVGGVSNAWELCKLILKATWLGIQLMFFTGVYKVMDLIDRLKLGWKCMGVAIADYAGDMKVSVLTTLQNMVNGAIDIINKFTSTVNSIFGSNIAVIEHVTFATTAAAENEAAKQSRHADLSAYQQDLENAKAARDAHLDDLRAQLAENEATFQATLAKGKEEAAAKNAASQAALDSIGADTASVAESAGSAAASLKENTEDLKYMRDLAEQEVINRFTTAEVKIDYSGMTNRIDSDMDLDGVLTTLTDGFAEAIEVAAEGVHV